ncbi:MAG: formyltetrahydrofolate deformylase [Oceanococcus sp.]
MTTPVSHFVLSFRCPDQAGIIAAISGFFFEQGCDIREAAQFGDPETKMFFARMEFAAPEQVDLAGIEQQFSGLAERFALEYQLHDMKRRLRTLIACSRQDHCVADLLHRWHAGLLHTDIVGVVSNHEDMQRLTEWHGLPYFYLPVSSDNKQEQERALLALMEEQQVDLLVLARYMQILSNDMCQALEGRCINIHHSFLPGFKGARPYHRAHERGVKLIGATAHFVTADLDEGPIIEQDVVRVDHATSAQDMVNLGREVETRVLASAVRWYVEHRLNLNGPRTIIFS